MGSRFQLAATLPILVFLQIIHWVSGQYNIIRPHSSITGIVGNGAILPCQLQGKIILNKLSIQWIFSRNSIEHGVASFDGKNPRKAFLEFEAYRGRTEFFPSEFQQGNLSLLLKNIQPSDKGKYICVVFLENWYNEVMVELDVAAQGAEPSVSLDGHSGNGISLSCRSQGWFPAPSMVWLDSQGQTRREEVTTLSTPGSSPGVFDVVSSMSLEPGSDREVSCRVVNEVLNARLESRVRIADYFFPSPSPWMFASLAILSLDLGIIGAVVYKIIRSITQAKKAERLRAELDFWEARSHAVPVVLDLETWPLYLHYISYKSRWEVLVAQEALGARKCYWEVELGQQWCWAVGVVRSKQSLPSPHSQCSQCSQHSQHSRDFWALVAFYGELFSCDYGDLHGLGDQREGFSVVGVFLDLEKGRLEFYDVERKDLMKAISLRTGAGRMRKFFPFVSQGELGPLRICRVPIPVPICF